MVSPAVSPRNVGIHDTWENVFKSAAMSHGIFWDDHVLDKLAIIIIVAVQFRVLQLAYLRTLDTTFASQVIAHR